MQSTHYKLPVFSSNHGSGAARGNLFQISTGVLPRQPVGQSSSSNFQIEAEALESGLSSAPSCGILINNDQVATNNPTVTLSLICSDSDGCSEVSISNNGFNWPATQSYSLSTSWDLDTFDGEKKVFVKYKDSAGNWSGVCGDSILLDTRPPTISATLKGATYMSSQSVGLVATEPATIYYTTDGSEPTTGSTVYAAPISLVANTVLKFFAVDLAGNVGPVATEDYTVCSGTNLKISGTVKDSLLNQNVPAAIVRLNTGQEAIANTSGVYSFTNLPKGYYSIESVSVPTPGYVTYQKEMTLCNGNVSNDILLTKDATVFGVGTSSGYSGDNVNTSTGNYSYSNADLRIPGRGIPFGFIRTYNSQDGSDGPLGYGWTHNYNTSLTEGTGGEITVRWGDGKIETWSPDGNGGYTPMYGVFTIMVKNPDSTYVLKLKDLSEYHFDPTGLLTAIIDEYGNTISFTYSGGNLVTVNDTVGRTITFTSDAFGRITSITDPINRSVTFAYDVNGDLISSTDLDGNQTSYAYDDSHRILTITDPLGNVAVTNVYDDQRNVVASQKDALGGETLYTYDVDHRTTQIIDPLGNISYHHYDDLLRLIQEDDPLGHLALYGFDERGNLISATDKNGNVTTYTHDDNGNVLAKTEPLGRVTSATYDGDNNPLTKTDANGNVTTYTYDTFGSLLTETDAQNNVTTYTYDEYGQPLTVTDALNHTSTNYFDIYGNLVSVIDPLGNTSTFTYDTVGRKTAESHPLGRGMLFAYDNMDRLVSVTDVLGNITRFTYDDNGNKTEHLDANGNKTAFAYDAKNRLVSRTDPLSNSETFVYDLLDRKIGVTDALGGTTWIQYDPLGNASQATDAQGNTMRYSYDANGNKTKTIDAMGNETTYAYDALNRLVSTTDALGNGTSYSFNPNGNQLTTTNALGKTITSTYDTLNRLVTKSDPLGNTITNTYDELGRLVTVTDARSNSTQFVYDELGRLVTVTDAEGGIVSATYDALGNRLTLTDTLGKTTAYEYDLLNRLTRKTDPLGNAEVMVYDAVGNLASSSTADGTTTYSYDQDDRPTLVTYPDTTTKSYTYDAVGNRLTANGGVGTTSFTFNTLGQVTSVTDPFGLTVGYTYNPNGGRTSIKYPGNKIVFYTYDELNRLASVTDWGGVSTAYSYDALSRLVSKTYGNGAVESFSYDDAGRLLTKEDRDPGNNLIAGYTLTMDANGNRTSADMVQPLMPLLDNNSDAFTHNDGNQVVSGPGETYTYDNRGNRVRRDDAGVATQYTFNHDDQLTSVVHGTDTYNYQYNADGKRLASVNNGAETRYLLDLNGEMEFVLAEMDDANQASKYYIYGDGLLYSIDGTTGERLYYHYDPIGSTVAISDATGAVTDKYAYLPFGGLNRSEAVHDNPFLYVGKFGVMQEPSGLQFMRARFYDTETRRFMSRDSIKGSVEDTQSLNSYFYGRGNPYARIDPNGEAAVTLYFIYDTVNSIFDSILFFGGNAWGGWSKEEREAEWSFYVAGIIPVVDAPSSMTKGVYYATRGKSRLNCGIDVLCHAGYSSVNIGDFSGEYIPDQGTYVPEEVKQDFSNFSYTDLEGDDIETNHEGNDIASDGEITLSPAEKSVKHQQEERKEKTWADIQEETRMRRDEAWNKMMNDRFQNDPAVYAAAVREQAREDRRRAREEKKRRYEAYARSVSKHAVVVYDLNKLPSSHSGGGVYSR